MMKSLKLEESANTYTAAARALVFNKDYEMMLQELEQAVRNQLVFKEEHIMEIVKTLAAMGEYLSIPNVKNVLNKRIIELQGLLYLTAVWYRRGIDYRMTGRIVGSQ